MERDVLDLHFRVRRTTYQEGSSVTIKFICYYFRIDHANSISVEPIFEFLDVSLSPDSSLPGFTGRGLYLRSNAGHLAFSLLIRKDLLHPPDLAVFEPNFDPT
jgi:hypothetical protein